MNIIGREETMNIALRLADAIATPEQPIPTVDIGAQCFGAADGSVINYRGRNYVPQRHTLRVRLHNWLVRYGCR